MESGRKEKKSEELIFEKFRVEQEKEAMSREMEDDKETIKQIKEENKLLSERLEREVEKGEEERMQRQIQEQNLKDLKVRWVDLE